MDLKYFFQENPKVALAFSGGVDSAYLLYAAMENGAQVRAYYVKSVFQPQFELEDARRLAAELGADMRELKAEVLDPAIAANPADRCYYCKKKIFAAIAETAAADGFPVLMDGTNASDNAGDRPGMRALAELSVRSPLRECRLTKDEIRRRSKEAGLFTWDKPAYACLATRIPTGTEITEEKLCRTERAESYLASVGLRDFRVRMVPTDSGRDSHRASACGAPWGAESALPGAVASGEGAFERMQPEEKPSDGWTFERMPPEEEPSDGWTFERMPPEEEPSGEGAFERMQPEKVTSGEGAAADMARLQVTEGDIPLLLGRRKEILAELKKYYSAVLLDLEVRG